MSIVLIVVALALLVLVPFTAGFGFAFVELGILLAVVVGLLVLARKARHPRHA